MAEPDTPGLGVLAPGAQKKGLGGIGGFFKGKPEDTGPSPVALQSVMEEVSNANRRVRVLEDRYQTVRNKVQIIEQNLLDNQKKAVTDQQAIQSELLSLKRAISELDAKTTTIIKEILLSAKKEDVDILQKYLDLWEPVHFVTREQVERMIRDAVEIAMARMEK